MQYSIKYLLNSLFLLFKQNSDLCSLTWQTIWGEASKWTPYCSDNIINLISFWDSLPFPLISDITTGLKNDLIRWPVPSKEQKKIRKEESRWNKIQDRHKLIIMSKHMLLPVFLTRRRCAGCWLWAAPDTLWWRSHRCCCSSGSPGTVAHRAGLPRTPWHRTPARTAMSMSPLCPPPAELPLHPSHCMTLRGVQGV